LLSTSNTPNVTHAQTESGAAPWMHTFLCTQAQSTFCAIWPPGPPHGAEGLGDAVITLPQTQYLSMSFDIVLAARPQNAVCAVRPSGHHAQMMGVVARLRGLPYQILSNMQIKHTDAESILCVRLLGHHAGPTVVVTLLRLCLRPEACP